MALTELRRTAIEIDEDTFVEVVISHDDEGNRVVTLSGVGCDLEGEMPGEYWIVPEGTIAARFAPPAAEGAR